MTDTSEARPHTDELAELVNSSFPDLRCLRCGHDQFLLASDVDALSAGGGNRKSVLLLHGAAAGETRHPVVTLACTRCGHLEQHLTAALRRAAKPISRTNL